jgi:hypothetical protein
MDKQKKRNPQRKSPYYKNMKPKNLEKSIGKAQNGNARDLKRLASRPIGA